MRDISKIKAVLPQDTIEIIRSKFGNWPEDKFILVLSETLKMISICIWTERAFLPCNGDVDQMWHELILETRTYRMLCEAIRPGKFLDHTGISFSEYQRLLSPKEIESIQLSILASYFASFGDFTPETLPYWIFAKEISERMEWSIVQFNAFCKELVSCGKRSEVSHA